jgi:hypothetical protein
VIYLAAQRVRDRQRAVGINSYCYNVEPDVAHLWASIDDHAGTLVASSITIKPGFNAILSYLDIVLPDRWRGSISEVLEPLDGAIAMATLPLTRSLGDAHVRFGAVIGLSGEPARLEFHTLARALVALNATSSSTSTAAPKIRLIRRSEGSRDVYRLSSHGSISVTVATDTASNFQTYRSEDILPYVAGALTGMSVHELAQAGGVDVYDDHGGLVLSWPAKTG